MIPRKGNALQSTLQGPYPVTFVDSMEAIASIRAVGDSENDQTYVVFSYAYQQGCKGIARDRTRLAIEEYGQSTLDELGDIILEDEICYIVYHFGKGHRLDCARNHAIQMEEARKWKKILITEKRSRQNCMSRALYGWAYTVEANRAAAESERLLGICHELSMQAPDPAPPSPLILVEQLCAMHPDLDRIFSDVIKTSADPDPYFVACARVAEELDRRRKTYLEQEVKKKLRLEHLKKAKEADHRAKARKKEAYKAILYKNAPAQRSAAAAPGSSQSTARSSQVPDSSRGPAGGPHHSGPGPAAPAASLSEAEADSSGGGGSPRTDLVDIEESGSDPPSPRRSSRASPQDSPRPPVPGAAAAAAVAASREARSPIAARLDSALGSFGGGGGGGGGGGSGGPSLHELNLLLIEARAGLGREEGSDERIQELEDIIRRR